MRGLRHIIYLIWSRLWPNIRMRYPSMVMLTMMWSMWCMPIMVTDMIRPTMITTSHFCPTAKPQAQWCRSAQPGSWQIMLCPVAASSIWIDLRED